MKLSTTLARLFKTGTLRPKCEVCGDPPPLYNVGGWMCKSCAVFYCTGSN